MRVRFLFPDAISLLDLSAGSLCWISLLDLSEGMLAVARERRGLKNLFAHGMRAFRVHVGHQATLAQASADAQGTSRQATISRLPKKGVGYRAMN